MIPSLPFLPSASLPEVVWVVVSLVGMVIAVRAWLRDHHPRARLKNSLRSLACSAFLVNGVAAMFTPPAVNPTWLSVMTPLAIAFGGFSMALLSVIDEQSPMTPTQ